MVRSTFATPLSNGGIKINPSHESRRALPLFIILPVTERGRGVDMVIHAKVAAARHRVNPPRAVARRHSGYRAGRTPSSRGGGLRSRARGEQQDELEAEDHGVSLPTHAIDFDATTNESFMSEFESWHVGRGIEPFAAMAALAVTDQDRPRFHLQPVAGWHVSRETFFFGALAPGLTHHFSRCRVNDPTAAFYSHGRYHVFYQHLPLSTDWSFGLVWGHASSPDLVHWQRLPDVLEPTPGHPDADGAFSGCIVADGDDTPTILYTGAHCFEETDKNVPAPPGEKVFQETVLAAACGDHIDSKGNPRNDSRLITWEKHKKPVIDAPPAEIEDELIGWRDPFVWQEPDGRWRMIIGAGFRAKGGAVLVYESHEESCTEGWEYKGVFAQGDDTLPGVMWECPWIVSLAPFDMLPYCAVETNEARLLEITDETPPECSNYHLFCMSPDGPWQPVYYWIGELSEDGLRFDVDKAFGPYRLDAGDILYAPRAAHDNRGRVLLWGWLQEARAEGTSPCSAAGYAGCLSLPRVLTLDFTHGFPMLLQDPPAEIEKLRLSGKTTSARQLEAGHPHRVKGVKGTSIEIYAQFWPGSATEVGFKLDYLTPWEPDDSPAGLILYNFQTGTLRAVKTEPGRPPRPESMGRHTAVQVTNSLTDLTYVAPIEDDPVCDINDPSCELRAESMPLREEEPLQLRMFVDGSCVEVFANSMAVLTTRIYRAAGGEGLLGAEEVAEEVEERSPAISAIALDGDATLQSMEAYTMKSCFVDDMCALCFPLPSRENAIKLLDSLCSCFPFNRSTVAGHKFVHSGKTLWRNEKSNRDQ